MGGYAQPDFLSGIEKSLEGVALPGIGVGARKRDGWLSKLLNIGPEGSPQPWDEKLPTGSQIRSDGQPTLAQLMTQGEGGQSDSGMSTPESTYSANGQTRLVDHVQNHRIED